VQIADRERRDLGAAQPDLQSDRQDRPVAQSGDGLFRWHVEQFARLRFREGEGRTFVAIDRRPFDLADRVTRGVPVPHQVLVERGQGREPAADRRRSGVLNLAHVPLPLGWQESTPGTSDLIDDKDGTDSHTRQITHVRVNDEPERSPPRRPAVFLSGRAGLIIVTC